MDDEFRHTLAEFDDATLAQLAADKTALRRIRPVGVSHREALAMIAAIREARSARAAAEARRRDKAHQAGPIRARRGRFFPTAGDTSRRTIPLLMALAVSFVALLLAE